MKRMQNVGADNVNRNIKRVRVESCFEDHGGYSTTIYAHNCPALALQRAIKARGYRVERDEETLFVYTTLGQYRRLFYKAQQAAEAKYVRWVTAQHIDMHQYHRHRACATCQAARNADLHAPRPASRLQGARA